MSSAILYILCSFAKLRGHKKFRSRLQNAEFATVTNQSITTDGMPFEEKL